jgi:hypothetical protein
MMSRRLFVVHFLVWFLLLPSCVLERGTGSFTDFDQEVQIDFEIPDVSTTEGELELSGHWVLFTEDRRCILPDVGDVVENIVWSFYLITFDTASEGSALIKLNSSMCYQYLSPLPFGFVTVIPRAVITSLSPLEYVGFLVDGNVGAPFLTEPVVDAWGYENLDDSQGLPLGPDDERIFDQDEDGKPGVSLSIETVQGNSICDVQVVQRNAFSLEGSVTGHTQIEGAFNVNPQQTILSSSSALCTTGGVVPSQAPSRFELIRLSDDLTSCAAMLENLDRVRQRLVRAESIPDAQEFCPDGQ